MEEGISLESLAEWLHIVANFNAERTLVILNYDQIDSKPENHPIVMECRNLVLEVGTWKLVSKSFRRFWNHGQHPLDHVDFRWDSFSVEEKCDGSLMSLFYCGGKWQVVTRGSFADGLCGLSGKAWSQLFFEALSYEVVDRVCSPGTTYTFEFGSPWNKVVAEHKTTTLFLLTCFAGSVELPSNEVDSMANQLGVLRPTKYDFKSIEEILQYIDLQAIKNPTWEGVVIRDCNGLRQKIKNPSYLHLHRLANNGEGFKPKNLLRFALDGEVDEALVYIERYFAEAVPMLEKVKKVVDTELEQMLELWHEVKDIEVQKEFALAIKHKTKLTSVLFKARQTGESPEKIFRGSEDLVFKLFFK
jgi:hypothetical protein